MNLIFEHGIWSFANAEIWVGIGLIIFFGILIAAGVPKMAGKALDAKAVKIQADLDEAARLRAEAEALLAQIRKEKAYVGLAVLIRSSKSMTFNLVSSIYSESVWECIDVHVSQGLLTECWSLRDTRGASEG